MSDVVTVPPFHGNINFNAQHAPVGAYMSFTCGHFGSGGGIGLELGRPAGQNLYVGVKQGNRRAAAPIKCLPFVRREGAFTSAAATFQVEQADNRALPPSVQCYGADEIRRHYGWASDTWETDDLSFSIYTPFAPVPEPGSDLAALRAALLPAIVATLTVDNRKGECTKTGVFALDFPDSGTRLLQPTATDACDGPATDRAGFAWRRSMGVMGTLAPAGDNRTGDAGEALCAFQRWSVAEGIADVNPVHELGSCGGLAFQVPPGAARTLVVAIGAYLDGVVTTGIEGRYYYTRCYTSLDDVLSAALDRADELRGRARQLDRKLLASRLSVDQQFLVAHGTRGYYGHTQLLEVGGEPFWVVNEGEYRMMNTLDLAVDHAFWELEHNPWVVRNLLDNFAARYSYHDTLAAPGGELLPGGVTFCHDMGVNNNFSRPGHSSYELAHLTGCFSYMSQEQLCNWVLLAASYVATTDDLNWLAETWPLLQACAQSLRNRANQRTGVMAHDSSRCAGGREITTYDSLDESLGQARGNTYLAGKCWAAWVGLEMLAAMRAAAAVADDGVEPLDSMAAQLAAHLAAAARPDGTIPAVLEKDSPGNRSHILPAAEALVYPCYWLNRLRSRATSAAASGIADAEQVVIDALRSPLVAALRRHTVELLADEKRRNLFPDGGIKLSSTSNNSWISKIAIFQFVARQVLRLHEDAPRVADLFRAADAAHVRWQTDGGGFWACSDQMVSGHAKASRYYPRVITTALWLGETPRKEPPAARRTPPAGAAAPIPR